MVPRLFAHSFFNPKDIPFLVSCILAVFSMIRFLDRPGLKWAFWHGLACALAIDIRIIGIIFPALTIGLIVAELLLSPGKEKSQKKNTVKWSILYLVFTTILMIGFWPYTWENPWEHFLFSLKSMSDYPWQGSLLFLGEIYTPVEYLPSSFFPVWFSVITPPVLLIGFVFSLFHLLKFKRISFISAAKTDRLLIIALFLFIVPSMLPILLRSVLYDDCRHLFFVYPFFVISALYGFLWLYQNLEKRLKLKKGHFYLVIGFLLIPVLIRMINIHPYQNVYFNDFAGKNIKENFEIDYWGVSCKEGLDYILKDTARTIPVRIMMDDSLLSPVVYNSFLLDQEALKQIEWVSEIKQADYFMTTYRCVANRSQHLLEWSVDSSLEVKSVYVNGIKILSVFNLQND
jgi:hypothetical protein